MHRQCLYGPINSYHSFLWSNLILCLYNVDTFNICMKKFGLEKIFFDKMTAVRTQTILPNKAFVYAQMVPSWADQLLPQLLMEQFVTLPIQFKHIEHMHEGVLFRKNNFDKMTTVRTQTIIPLYGFCICMDSAFMGRSTPTTAFDGAI